MTFGVRTTMDPMSLSGAAANAIHAKDADVALARVQPLATYVSGSLARRRFATGLVGVFGLLALLLAGVGVYA
jgi:hypothetical protein